jgi:alkylation response protein AidB-like acyl-CoA dehydrogenase
VNLSTMSRDTQELLAAAAKIAPGVAEAAPQALELRRAPDSSVEALINSGLTVMSLPLERGGHRAPTAVQAEVMATLAEADGSFAWVTSIYNAVSHMVCAFGDEALDEFLDAAVPRAAGVFAPTGQASAAKGGYRVTGGWGFSSGQHHAGWIIVPAIPEGGGPPIAFLVPKAEFAVKDDWFVTGFIGTGSNTVTLDDVFVPEHRAIPFMDIVLGNYRTASLAGDPYYNNLFVPFMCAMSVGPAIGLGRAALRLFEERIGSRGITYTNYSQQSEAPVTHFQLAEARMKLDQATFHADRITTAVDEHAASGAPWDVVERIRCRADIAWAIKLTREACELIEHGSGANAIRAKDKLPSILRDIRTMSVHSFLLHSTNAELYGRILAGHEPGVPFV